MINWNFLAWLVISFAFLVRLFHDNWTSVQVIVLFPFFSFLQPEELCGVIHCAVHCRRPSLLQKLLLIKPELIEQTTTPVRQSSWTDDNHREEMPLAYCAACVQRCDHYFMFMMLLNSFVCCYSVENWSKRQSDEWAIFCTISLWPSLFTQIQLNMPYLQIVMKVPWGLHESKRVAVLISFSLFQMISCSPSSSPNFCDGMFKLDLFPQLSAIVESL